MNKESYSTNILLGCSICSRKFRNDEKDAPLVGICAHKDLVCEECQATRYECNVCRRFSRPPSSRPKNYYAACRIIEIYKKLADFEQCSECQLFWKKEKMVFCSSCVIKKKDGKKRKFMGSRICPTCHLHRRKEKHRREAEERTKGIEGYSPSKTSKFELSSEEMKKYRAHIMETASRMVIQRDMEEKIENIKENINVINKSIDSIDSIFYKLHQNLTHVWDELKRSRESPIPSWQEKWRKSARDMPSGKDIIKWPQESLALFKKIKKQLLDWLAGKPIEQNEHEEKEELRENDKIHFETELIQPNSSVVRQKGEELKRTIEECEEHFHSISKISEEINKKMKKVLDELIQKMQNGSIITSRLDSFKNIVCGIKNLTERAHNYLEECNSIVRMIFPFEFKHVSYESGADAAVDFETGIPKSLEHHVYEHWREKDQHYTIVRREWNYGNPHNLHGVVESEYQHAEDCRKCKTCRVNRGETPPPR